MDKFDIAAYGAAITAIGGPILLALRYAIKKGTPFVQLYFNKLIKKIDEVVDESKDNNECISRHLVESEERKKQVDNKFLALLEIANSNSKKIEETLEIANSNTKRIEELELVERQAKLNVRERNFEREKEQFQEDKEC